MSCELFAVSMSCELCIVHMSRDLCIVLGLGSFVLCLFLVSWGFMSRQLCVVSVFL